MGLKNSPAFETETETSDTTVIEGEVMNTTTETTSTAVAPAAATTAVTAPRASFATAYGEFNGAFDVQTVTDMSMNVPRITGEQGSLFLSKTEELGEKVKVEIMSYNPRWVISTGEKKEKNAETNDFLRFSYDGKVTTKGENVETYIDSLKAQGFKNASAEQYLDIYGLLVWSSKGGDVPEDTPKFINVQCSPTSRGAFVTFTKVQGVLASRAKNAYHPSIVEIHAEKRRNNAGEAYTNLSFHPVIAK